MQTVNPQKKILIVALLLTQSIATAFFLLLAYRIVNELYASYTQIKRGTNHV